MAKPNQNRLFPTLHQHARAQFDCVLAEPLPEGWNRLLRQIQEREAALYSRAIIRCLSNGPHGINGVDGLDLGLVGRQGLETSLLQRLDISMFIRGDVFVLRRAT
jgi:hypothetical protein